MYWSSHGHSVRRSEALHAWLFENQAHDGAARALAYVKNGSFGAFVPQACIKTPLSIRGLACALAKSAAVLSAALWVTSSAHAQLAINEPVIEMRAADASEKVEFRNTGDTTIVVTLDLQQVISPATSNPVNERTVPAEASGVSINPRVLEIPAHQSAYAQVLRELIDLDTEQVYRLRVKPVRSATTSSIVLNYDLLLLVRPEKASPSISLKRTSSGVALVNLGNSNALMSSMQLCDQSIDACHSLSAQRLYANERWSVPVPKHFDIDHLVLHAEQAHHNTTQSIEYRASQNRSL